MHPVCACQLAEEARLHKAKTTVTQYNYQPLRNEQQVMKRSLRINNSDTRRAASNHNKTGQITKM